MQLHTPLWPPFWCRSWQAPMRWKWLPRLAFASALISIGMPYCGLAQENQSEHCDDWAESGECDSNAEYMWDECPASCASYAPDSKPAGWQPATGTAASEVSCDDVQARLEEECVRRLEEARVAALDSDTLLRDSLTGDVKAAERRARTAEERLAMGTPDCSSHGGTGAAGDEDHVKQLEECCAQAGIQASIMAEEHANELAKSGGSGGSCSIEATRMEVDGEYRKRLQDAHQRESVQAQALQASEARVAEAEARSADAIAAAEKRIADLAEEHEAELDETRNHCASTADTGVVDVQVEQEYKSRLEDAMGAGLERERKLREQLEAAEQRAAAAENTLASAGVKVDGGAPAVSHAETPCSSEDAIAEARGRLDYQFKKQMEDAQSKLEQEHESRISLVRAQLEAEYRSGDNAPTGEDVHKLQLEEASESQRQLLERAQNAEAKMVVVEKKLANATAQADRRVELVTEAHTAELETLRRSGEGEKHLRDQLEEEHGTKIKEIRMELEESTRKQLAEGRAKVEEDHHKQVTSQKTQLEEAHGKELGELRAQLDKDHERKLTQARTSTDGAMEVRTQLEERHKVQMTKMEASCKSELGALRTKFGGTNDDTQLKRLRQELAEEHNEKLKLQKSLQQELHTRQLADAREEIQQLRDNHGFEAQNSSVGVAGNCLDAQDRDNDSLEAQKALEERHATELAAERARLEEERTTLLASQESLLKEEHAKQFSEESAKLQSEFKQQLNESRAELLVELRQQVEREQKKQRAENLAELSAEHGKQLERQKAQMLDKHKAQLADVRASLKKEHQKQPANSHTHDESGVENVALPQFAGNQIDSTHTNETHHALELSELRLKLEWEHDQQISEIKEHLEKSHVDRLAQQRIELEAAFNKTLRDSLAHSDERVECIDGEQCTVQEVVESQLHVANNATQLSELGAQREREHQDEIAEMQEMITQMEAVYQNHLANTTAELEAERQKHASFQHTAGENISKMQGQSEEDHEQQVAELRSQLEKEHKEKLEAVHHTAGENISKMRGQLEEEHVQQVAEVRSQLETEHKDKLDAVQASSQHTAGENISKIRGQLEEEHVQQVAELRSQLEKEHKEKLDAAELSLERTGSENFQQQLAQLETNHTEQIAVLRADLEEERSKRASEAKSIRDGLAAARAKLQVDQVAADSGVEHSTDAAADSTSETSSGPGAAGPADEKASVADELATLVKEHERRFEAQRAQEVAQLLQDHALALNDTRGQLDKEAQETLGEELRQVGEKHQAEVASLHERLEAERRNQSATAAAASEELEGLRTASDTAREEHARLEALQSRQLADTQALLEEARDHRSAEVRAQLELEADALLQERLKALEAAKAEELETLRNAPAVAQARMQLEEEYELRLQEVEQHAAELSEARGVEIEEVSQALEIATRACKRLAAQGSETDLVASRE